MFRRAGTLPHSFGVLPPSSISCRPVNALAPLACRCSQPRTIATKPLPVPTTDILQLFRNIRKQITLLHSSNGGPSDSEVDAFNKIVNTLRTSLEEGNLLAAGTHWSLLEQQKLSHSLGPSHLENLSRLIAKACVAGGARDEMELQAIRDMALFAAAGRAPSGLQASMMFFIRGNNPNAVLELNRRFLGLLEERGNWEGNENGGEVEPEEASYDILARTSTRDHGQDDPRRASILLAVVTAYAMKDSFGEALQASLSTDLRLPPFTVKEFLKGLGHDPPLQHKVEEYVRRLAVARLVNRPPSFVKHVTNLSRDQSVDRLEKLYGTIIDGISGPNAYLSTHSSAMDPRRPVFVGDIAWASLLSAFLRCQRTDLAEKLWDDMLKFGIQTGVSLWTALFDGYDSMGAVKEVLSGWETMLSEGVTPDALTYRALISTLFNGKKPDEALKRFRMFEELRPSSTWDTAHSLSVYNTVLHGLFTNSREKEAIEVLHSMKENGPNPDIVSYNTILRYYCRRGDFRAVATQVRELTSAGLVGDVFTFSTILSALLKVGREDATQMMVHLMEKQGVKPNVATYSAIIDQQMREQNEKNFHAALRLLQNMEQDPQTQPNEVTYTTILAGMYRGQWLDPRVAEEHRQDIVQRMQSRDIRPNKLTYRILLKACLKYPEPEGLRSALFYYREMVKRRIPMAHETWYILLHGLMDREEWGIANEMVWDMARSGFHPAGALLDLVNTVRKRTTQKRKSGPSGYL